MGKSLQSGRLVSNSRIFVNSAGNIGIGTDNPGQTLTVQGTTSLMATNSTNQWMAYTYTDNTFRLNYNGSGADEITITSAGKIGVGNDTSGFSTRLIVGTGSGETGNMTLYSGTSSSSFIHFADGNSGADRYRGYVTYQHSDNSMLFGTNDVERLRIGSSGEIGIGGQNYGTSGQVLTSGGSGAAPTWTTVSGCRWFIR